jgi:hypothetical protein
VTSFAVMTQARVHPRIRQQFHIGPLRVSSFFEVEASRDDSLRRLLSETCSRLGYDKRFDDESSLLFERQLQSVKELEREVSLTAKEVIRARRRQLPFEPKRFDSSFVSRAFQAVSRCKTQWDGYLLSMYSQVTPFCSVNFLSSHELVGFTTRITIDFGKDEASPMGRQLARMLGFATRRPRRGSAYLEQRFCSEKEAVAIATQFCKELPAMLSDRGRSR